MHSSVCALTALQVWLAVLKGHGINSGPLFPSQVAGRLQGGTRFSHSSYSTTLGYISTYLNLPGNLTEHSARRGGVQYLHFVLNFSLHTLFKNLTWESEGELLKYVGVCDTDNQYVLLGYGGDLAAW